MKLAKDYELSSEIFDLCDSMLRYARCYWLFWDTEQEERALSQIYAEYLIHLIKDGYEEDLNQLMIDLTYESSPFNLRLLKNLHKIRSREE